MKTLLSKLKNSDFLTAGERLRLKISVVLFFMLTFSALTVPISVFEEFALGVVIIVPAAVLLMFLISSILLIADKVRLAMHFSIYTFIALTVYFVTGTSLLYGYFLIFITLTIIIFYQDIYTYILYGSALTIYGVFYIAFNGEQLMNVIEDNTGFSNGIYSFVLVSFYLVFLTYFILSDSIYEKLQKSYLMFSKNNEKHRSYALKYYAEIIDKDNIKPFFENNAFQKVVSETATFINEFLEEKPEGITEVVEFYFFLHKYDLSQVLENQKLNDVTKQYARELHPYLLHRDNEFASVWMDFIAQFKSGFDDRAMRSVTQINTLFSSRTNKLIALALIYTYLRNENTQPDKWGRLERPLSHDQIIEHLNSGALREIISYEEILFIINNQELFDKNLR